jgi:hypothetical protein
LIQDVISYYPPAVRRQVLSKHFLIAAPLEQAFDGSTRTASAAAMEQTDLVQIHRVHFLPYVKADPGPGRLRLTAHR